MGMLSYSFTFFHIMWENQPIAHFWNLVVLKLSQLLSVNVPTTIFVFFLDDLSVFIKQQRKLLRK